MASLRPWLSGLAAAAALLAAGSVQAAPLSPWETIGCRENAQVADPITVDPSRYRVLLGKVALPSSEIVHEAVEQAEQGRQRYFAKLGLLLRIGSGPVDVRLAPGWGGRASIGWGYPNLHDDTSAWLRFRGCPLPRHGKPWSEWIAYAGGVSVSRPACVPLVVSAGGRTARLELAIGRRCG